MYIPIAVFCVMIGVFFTWVSWAFPVQASQFYIPWASAIFYILAPTIMLVRLKTSQAKFLFDPPPKGKQKLILFVHRDQLAEFKYGKKVRDTSFIDVPDVGIIHDTGKDAVIRIGDKFVRIVPENISYPLPLWVMSFITKLQRAGFTDLQEVYDFIEGKLDKKRENELLSNLVNIEAEPLSEISNLESRLKEKITKGKLEEMKEKAKEKEKKAEGKKKGRPSKIDQIHKAIDELEIRRR